MYRGGNIIIKKGYITLVFSILLLFLGTLLINIKNNTLTNEAFIPAGILSVIFIVVQIISVKLRKNADNYLLSLEKTRDYSECLNVLNFVISKFPNDIFYKKHK